MIFYYFLPKLAKEAVASGGEFDRQVLAAAGLVSAVPGQSPGPLEDVRKVPVHASLCTVHNNAGPGGQPGTLICPVSKLRGPPPIVTPALDRQIWRPVGDGSKLWIGALKSETPKPQDLERWETIGGAIVKDDAGCEWRVPVGRAPHLGLEFGTLPQSYTFGEDGEPKGNLSPAYTWLWQLASDVRDYYRSVPPGDDATPEEKAAYEPPSFNWLIKQAARILAVNYRVGPAELSFLHALGHGVLTQHTVHAIAQACFGLEVLEEAKKKPPDGESSPPPS